MNHKLFLSLILIQIFLQLTEISQRSLIKKTLHLLIVFLPVLIYWLTGFVVKAFPSGKLYSILHLKSA